jgi:hypothetical protein
MSVSSGNLKRSDRNARSLFWGYGLHSDAFNETLSKSRYDHAGRCWYFGREEIWSRIVIVIWFQYNLHITRVVSRLYFEPPDIPYLRQGINQSAGLHEKRHESGHVQSIPSIRYLGGH